MAEGIWIGFTLGLAATLTPGPLATLVLSTTLQRGFAAGSRVSCGPVLTDAPIVAVTVFAASRLPDEFLIALGVLGGGFLMWLGYGSIRDAAAPNTEPNTQDARDDWIRGAVTNFLNPHPWAFWIAVGAPLLVRLWDDAAGAAIGFMAIFYLLLVGGKVVFAWLVDRGSPLLTGRSHLRLQRLAGVLLIGLGVVLVWQAVTGRI